MIHTFGRFELDERRRELRLDRREVVLQPLVFDLLAYLVRNRERLVKKEELLERLWPDAIVADGALQRAVSLARSALRQGELAEAIRTHARVGYSFRADVTDLREAAGADVPAPLERARRAFGDSQWAPAVSAFAEADRMSALDAADLERWAQATQYAGRLDDAAAPLERAVTAHAAAGDRRGAARAALHLALIQLDRREIPLAQGLRNRAATLLASQEGEWHEHGLLASVSSRIALYVPDLDESLQQAELAVTIARRLEDLDCEALGLLYQGVVRLARGEIEQGTALLDEAAAAALTERVGPWAAGSIYCGIVFGCINRGDWQRANQWTTHFNRYCERNGVAPFAGACRVHRAEVLLVRGELEEAEQEIEAVRALLARSSPFEEGDACRVLGEVRLARGDLDGAEEAFLRAYERGWDPQPGRALLQLRQGKADAALRALERSLAEPSWANQQRRGLLLTHLAVVAVEAGDHARARRAIEELQTRPALTCTPVLEALTARARAELASAEGATGEAIAHLRRAVQIWSEVGAPLHIANLRMRLAELLVEDGDPDTAALESAAARRLLQTTSGS